MKMEESVFSLEKIPPEKSEKEDFVAEKITNLKK